MLVLAMGTGPVVDGAAPQTPVAAPPAPAVAPSPAPSIPSALPAAPTPRADPVLEEACDGTRTVATVDPHALTCSRWTIAWREGGTAWGFVTAAGYDEVIAERERQLAFGRRYARYFEVPLDERYTDASAPICETCSTPAPAGRWGDGQKFGDGGAREAIAAAEAERQRLQAALDEHLPRLEDTARLAREPATARAARAYAKQLRHAVLDLAKSRLALDNAAVFRSEPLALDTSKSIQARLDALAASHLALNGAVAHVVEQAHGGRYLEEGGPDDPERPGLEVSFEGTKVVATYFSGGARSTWFQGTVALDGGITGQSLVAPDGGVLTCEDHSTDCGYVYIDSVLRFTERKDPDETTRCVAELWFQRATWVMAKPFVRNAKAG